MSKVVALNNRKEDALDKLREWIKIQKDMPYGSIKPEITIENHAPVKVEIYLGDKRVVITANTTFD